MRGPTTKSARDFRWGKFAFGGIDGITNLPSEADYVSVSRSSSLTGDAFRGWGNVQGTSIEVSAVSREVAKLAIAEKAHAALAGRQ